MCWGKKDIVVPSCNVAIWTLSDAVDRKVDGWEADCSCVTITVDQRENATEENGLFDVLVKTITDILGP